MKRGIGVLLVVFFVFVFVSSLSFISAAVYIESPANNTMNTTTVFFNVSFANGSSGDITDPVNATFYYNLSGTWTELGNTSYTDGCYVDPSGLFGSCNVTLDISGLTDGNYSINATISNGTDTVTATGLAFNVAFDSTPPAVNESSFVHPTSGTNVSASFDINVSITDATLTVNAVYFNITNLSGIQDQFYTASNPSGNWWNASFNISQFSDGLYNITVYANDSVGNLNNTGLVYSIRVDTVVPEVQAANITSPSSSSDNKGTVVLNVTVRDLNSSIGGVFFNITYSNGSQAAIAVATNPAGDFWNTTVDTTGLTDGVYNITIWANDTAGNLNNTALVHTVTFDNTGPSAGLTRSSSSSKTSIVIDIAVSDATSGISSTCTVDRDGATITGTGTTQTLTETGLDCGHSYAYTITCYDAAGNGNSTSAVSFSTDSCSASSAGSSGGGSSASQWTRTHVITDEQFAVGYTKEMKSKQRAKVSVSGETHYVGVLELTETSAKIEISSTPVTIELDVGEDAKVDLLEDGYYDIYVKLEGIADNKADVLIQKIHELIPEEEEGDVGATGEILEEEPELPFEEEGLPGWLIILIILIVLVVLVGGGVAVKKRRQ